MGPYEDVELVNWLIDNSESPSEIVCR